MARLATSSVAYLVGIQLFSRAVTFAANQILLSHISPKELGIAAQLELYSITVLYFSRESIRVAVQTNASSEYEATELHKKVEKSDSRRNSSRNSCQAVVNVSYVALILGLLLLQIFSMLYTRSALEEVLRTSHFQASLTLIGVATALELFAEPCFAAVQYYMQLRSRAIIETSASFAKGVLSCGTVLFMRRMGSEVGPLAFAVGQVSYSIVIFCGYFAVAKGISIQHGLSLFPADISESTDSSFLFRFLSPTLLYRSANLFFQSVVKHILTQGDSMILAALSTLEDQGLFALASNYGGLIARIIFQPIEESSRSIFGQRLPKNGEKTSLEDLAFAKRYLRDVLYAYSLLAVILWFIGPLLLPMVLELLLSHRWSSANVQGVLLTYCYYIPILAFNGMTEAFVSSAATNSELRVQAIWMAICSFVFVLTAYVLLKMLALGVQGLVWANMVNMSLRIGWSLWFILKYFSKNKQDLRLREFFPRNETCAFAAAVFAWSNTFVMQGVAFTTKHFIKMFLVAAAIGSTILYLERYYLKQQMLNFWPGNLRSNRRTPPIKL
ncbi:Oligosaccharide translocation protein rft1 [Ophidiomyces ophidiicola]|nr:Oligosaccharide translocation protein rft1 [Ophidiomyces ophidiicola]KAI1989544.1 Oligosaccharide translocation protein rft1 [Ophidiomyces ophidiicola]KAI1993363.1 Oligosaccharide translocation protein rft1 [Ophidiomyces ophidiicola]KAI1995659.1 Oligosaccharide translocation protein rft1 [Ophidiomyces ophidiicola]